MVATLKDAIAEIENPGRMFRETRSDIPRLKAEQAAALKRISELFPVKELDANGKVKRVRKPKRH